MVVRRSRRPQETGSIGPDHGCHGAVGGSCGVRAERGSASGVLVRRFNGTEGVYNSIIQSQNANHTVLLCTVLPGRGRCDRINNHPQLLGLSFMHCPLSSTNSLPATPLGLAPLLCLIF